MGLFRKPVSNRFHAEAAEKKKRRGDLILAANPLAIRKLAA